MHLCKGAALKFVFIVVPFGGRRSRWRSERDDLRMRGGSADGVGDEKSKSPVERQTILSAGRLGVATEAEKGSRGSDPRLLGLTMGRLLDRTSGVRPRASRIVHALGLDQPSTT